MSTTQVSSVRRGTLARQSTVDRLFEAVYGTTAPSASVEASLFLHICSLFLFSSYSGGFDRAQLRLQGMSPPNRMTPWLTNIIFSFCLPAHSVASTSHKHASEGVLLGGVLGGRDTTHRQHTWREHGTAKMWRGVHIVRPHTTTADYVANSLSSPTPIHILYLFCSFLVPVMCLPAATALLDSLYIR